MSAISQNFATVTFNGPQNSATNPFNPKYLKNEPSTHRYSLPDYQTNKLPLNLFMSAAEYNKMLITYGKNRKRPLSHLNDGFAVNLEYINDEVFQKINQKRAIARQNVLQAQKSAKKQLDECTCCCCKEFCQQCAYKRHCKNLSSSQVKRALSTIDNQIALVRKGQKISHHTSYKKSAKKQQYIKPKSAKSALSDNQSNKTRQASNHPGVDISHLIIKSLIWFEESRKKQAFLKDQKKSEHKARQQFMQLMNDRIRNQNLEALQNSKSKQKTKSLSKSRRSTNYWQKVKQQVFQNLKKDNYSGTLKKQLMNYHLNVYEHKQMPKRQQRLSKQKIEELRQKHEIQVKELIEQQIRQKQEKAFDIKRNLKELDQRRLEHIRSQPQKKFRPTEKMINQAFNNIIEPKQTVIQEHFETQTVKNHGLIKHGRNNTLKSKKKINK